VRIFHAVVVWRVAGALGTLQQRLPVLNAAFFFTAAARAESSKWKWLAHYFDDEGNKEKDWNGL
jgi:hypothetical protein